MTTLGLTVLFAVIVAFGALVGLCRGLNKSVIRLMTLVLAVAVSVCLGALLLSELNADVDVPAIGQNYIPADQTETGNSTEP